MDWTSEYPTVPGWYWMRPKSGSKHPTVALIDEYAMQFIDPRCEMEWWGPLDIPQEKPDA